MERSKRTGQPTHLEDHVHQADNHLIAQMMVEQHLQQQKYIPRL